MIIQELYDKITLANPCDQVDFLTHYDTTVRAILARYGKRYVLLPGTTYVRPTGLQDDSPVFEEYMNAIYDNILFMLTGNTDRKTDYVQEADDAYKTVWKSLMRGRKFRDSEYKYYL